MNSFLKLLALLTVQQRRVAGLLLGMMLIGTVMEMLGISLIIPALSVMMQGDLVARYPVLTPWLGRLGRLKQEELVVVGLITFVGVNAVKSVFLGFLAWRQAHYVYGLQADLSQRLFEGYLHEPYTFHLQHNSAHLIHNVIGQVNDITGVFKHGLASIAEILVMLGVSAVLFVVEPLGATVVLLAFGLAGWGFNRLSRKHILRWGQERQFHEGLRIQHLQQGLGGAKEVKLLGREGDFSAEYHRHNLRSARLAERQATIQALPRLWLELVSVMGLAALVMVMIGRGKGMDAVLPTVGLFVVAAFRVMPSTNRVLSGVQSVLFSLPAIDAIHSQLGQLNTGSFSPQGSRLPFNSNLEIDQISFRYPSVEVQALSDVSLMIPRGASVGFVGGSGAGKSTLVDLILGLLTPGGGIVKVDGLDIQENLRGWQGQIGYVPQSIFLTDDTLRRNIAFGLPTDKIDESAVWLAVRAAQLEQFVNDLPMRLDTTVGERGVCISGGERQRIGIARALYHNPQVLILDEATSSLDNLTEQAVMESVNKLRHGMTIILIAHRLTTVRECDQIYLLHRGCIAAQGTYDELVQSSEMFRAMASSNA